MATKSIGTTSTTRKRKRLQPRRQATNKRAKLTYADDTDTDDANTQSSSGLDVQSEPEDAEEFPVRAILEEKKGPKGERLFYVDWGVNNPVTGQAYPKEWRKEVDVGWPLVEAWDQEQAGKKKRNTLPQRKRRIVHSSPELSTPPKAPTAARKNTSPLIKIIPRSSFNANDYEPHSQIPATPQSAASARRSFIGSQSSQYSGPRNYRASGEVPDSEGEEDDAGAVSVDSWIATTQEELGSASYIPAQEGGSASTLTLTNDSDQVPASLAISNYSIPETEPDIIENLQLEQTQAKERREIPDTFESLDIIVSTSQPTPPSPASSALSAPDFQQPEPELEIQNSAIDDAVTEEEDAEITLDDATITDAAITEEEAENTIDASITEDETAIAESDAAKDDNSITNCKSQNAAQTIITDDSAEPAITAPTNYEAEKESEAQDQSCESSIQIQSTQPPQDFERDQSAPTAVIVQQDTASSAPPPVSNTQQNQVLDDSIERRDFVTSSNSVEQYAQAVPSSPCSSTQEISRASTQNSVTGSILTTVEKDPVPGPQTPQSRHDSSQESPVSQRSPSRLSQQSPASFVLSALSPLARPPPQSLNTLDSKAPARPHTPCTPRTQSFSMDDFDREMREASEKRQQEKPSPTPLLPRKPSKLFPHLNRSPSAIPSERSPAPQTSPSLLTVAMSNSAIEAQAAESTPAPEIEPEQISSVDEDVLSDSGSLFTNDLDLQQNEFIVPLPMDGRQSKVYADELNNNASKISAFLEDHQHQPLEEVNKILHQLRSIENHVDLLYGDPLSQASSAQSQYEHHAQWSNDNSIKFQFISSLGKKLQEEEMHIILVLEDEKLFKIVESFLRGLYINFKSPTQHTQADLSHVEGNLLITVLSSESDTLVQPPDLIICLDGNGHAGQIRAKNWSKNPDKPMVPILHLIIPRALAHVERYVSTSMNARRRLHTIMATLVQYHSEGEIGNAVHHNTPKAPVAADAIASFLLSQDDEWPLPPIGSIKEEVEFASQQSLAVEAPAAKRPLELEDGNNPAKRIRLTPQPPVPSEGNDIAHMSDTNEITHATDANEITHVSDSMPETAVHQRERALRREQEKQFNEERARWDKQQTVHEDLSRTYNGLKTAKEAAERREAQLRERLTTKTADYQALEARFKELQETLLMSDDVKVAEIARLRKEVDTAKESEARAIKNKRSTEEALEYIKDQYANAQDSATRISAKHEALSKKYVIAERKASGQINDLAKLHYEALKERDSRVEQQHAAQSKALQKQLQAQEESILKLKAAGRSVGAYTRGQSVGAGGSNRTRPGSRAASPQISNSNGRDRVTNLRNG